MASSPQKNLKIPQLLSAPSLSSPLYSIEIKDSLGSPQNLADPRAIRALIALMNQHAVIGGAAAHWGGPAGFAEVMSALHGLMFKSQPWFDSYHFINDAGHAENGLYALRALYKFDNLKFSDLRGFRSIKSKLTGHGEAHLNPEEVFISNGPLGSALAQAQGLAMADKKLNLKRTTICALTDGAAMEGEAKEALASIPGFAQKGLLNPFILLISDNNTKLSGRIDQDSYSMNPSLLALKTLGWDLQIIEKGHDLESIYHTLEQSLNKAKKSPSTPMALVFKTIKGHGVKKTENSPSGGHGYPLKAYDKELRAFIQEIYAPSPIPKEFLTWTEEILASAQQTSSPSSSSSKKEGPTLEDEKIQEGIARACEKGMEENLPLFSLSSDLQGSTGMASFHKSHPENALDMGIAESNMISTAIGFAKSGYIPLVDTFAQFGITKGNLPLMMANLSQAPLIALFSHAGFQDAADGASHQATTYFSALSSIPQTTLINVSCSKEAEEYLYQAFQEYKKRREQGETPHSFIFFYGREKFPRTYNNAEKFEWKKAQILKRGKDLTVVATGPMVRKALEGAHELKKEGIDITVINNSFINSPDIPTIEAALKETKGRLITMEDHQVICGMGAILTHALLQNGTSLQSYHALGIDGKFGRSAYKADELYAKNGLTVKKLKEVIKSLL